MSRNVTLSLKRNWKTTWQTPSLRILMLIGCFIAAILISVLPIFFQNIEKRPGIQLNDRILSHTPAYNVSIYLFLIIWSMALLTLVRAVYKPEIFIKYLWLYSAICITRMITITLIPLAPPANLMNLVDPLTGVFYGHANITKDLFYSGHVSTLLAMYYCLHKKSDKRFALLGAVVVGVLVLVQHVHYTIDVLAAPLFVFVLNKLLTALLFPSTRQ
ncbi:hypothetical protein HH214_02855 [Mucilaginibacter robiniae]|uniref:Sphingomyelin synthase-like domain-containing protein n=1 Tax=Mucilaginibacter robiniae TaxID=2728022 RepID=A0A7L5DV08_9SPHI|nr:hypothetical protein HH214_02855 [Mucilaginibacter robiniae]